METKQQTSELTNKQLCLHHTCLHHTCLHHTPHRAAISWHDAHYSKKYCTTTRNMYTTSSSRTYIAVDVVGDSESNCISLLPFDKDCCCLCAVAIRNVTMVFNDSCSIVYGDCSDSDSLETDYCLLFNIYCWQLFPRSMYLLSICCPLYIYTHHKQTIQMATDEPHKNVLSVKSGQPHDARALNINNSCRHDNQCPGHNVECFFHNCLCQPGFFLQTMEGACSASKCCVLCHVSRTTCLITTLMMLAWIMTFMLV